MQARWATAVTLGTLAFGSLAWPGDLWAQNGLQRFEADYADSLGLREHVTLAGGAPGTVSIARDGFPVVACGVGGLKLLTLQRAGKTAQPADSFLRGFSLRPGTVLLPPAVAALPV